MSLLCAERLCVFKRCWVYVRGQWWCEAFCQHRVCETQRLRVNGQDAALLRDTSSEVNTDSFRESCVFVCVYVLSLLNTHTAVCEHVYVSACAGWGYTWHKIDPSGQSFFRTSPCGQRERESKGDGDEGWWRMAHGVQQGWGSLLTKSHLRPPFTLNMGHCSCPDLGFDPQRCLTPTIPPELPPCHLESTHAYVYICTHTHRYICMYVYINPYIHMHMCPHRYSVRLCPCWC